MLIIDSRSVKSSEGGYHRGCDAGKKVSGRKRLAAVVVEGSLVEVLLTGADVSDNAGGMVLLDLIAQQFPSVRVIWCDQGFRKAFVEHAQQLGLQVVVICRQLGSTG